MTSKSLGGKTAVVTGASSGIGRAAALELARRGANIVLAARRAERLEAVVRECAALDVRATAVVADVTSRDDCRRLIESAGDVDILVNNAGFVALCSGTTIEINPQASALSSRCTYVIAATATAATPPLVEAILETR